MIIYSISVYSWPSSLLKTIETWSRNFIWSGDINKRKLVTVAWKNVCVPYEEGGLAIMSLRKINEASNFKLCWELLKSKEDWAKILTNRVLANRQWQHCQHLGRCLVWRSFESIVSYPPKCAKMTSNKTLNSLVHHATLPVESQKDKLIWNASSNGELSVKDAYEFKRLHLPVKGWAKTIWCKDTPPAKSLLAWRLVHGKIPTDDMLMLRGCTMASVCSLGHSSVESSFHLFFKCSFVHNIWCWFATTLNCIIQF
ncbi:hypothetical protein TSUD_327140 [Trifolium subterraneum]|uniref:Reverse transcriptase zinc-binding domain-containing protein n=1 Tax=Trifolium subterraneum TaxID=3900 RepID=A0A2Z6PFK6_TRISU|nr:hypothetical protein TSUD_327140 [Trifolium subterraneum]